jgi:hypothetical protein
MFRPPRAAEISRYSVASPRAKAKGPKAYLPSALLAPM